ncbi:MAG: methyltransferase domain-containing protein [Gammaproteobacteria bacterium]|nr:methyltransferase domain-containing protein [Gammaproteobacteria bacterium]
MSVICPLCRGPLARQPRVWRCTQGHSFDVAREGYVNLLPVQHKKSRDPGDDALMVMARRAFLEADHYRPLRDALLARLAPLAANTLLDIGCGEGYYTGAFADAVPEVIGVDIARTAVRMAARRHPGLTWLVASGAHLPLADASVDVITNVFTQLHVGEMQRVLRPDGHLLVVSPAARHLWTLREQLFDDVRAHQPDKFLATLEAGFTLLDRHEVSVPLQLSPPALQQLLQMTPYAWKARPEKRQALVAFDLFETEAVFSLMRFTRRPD